MDGKILFIFVFLMGGCTAQGPGETAAVTTTATSTSATTTSVSNEQNVTPNETPPGENWGTTYYIRSGGGSAVQCNGLADADYPGAGLNQPCAFNHLFWLLPPSGAPRMIGGDRVILAPGSYRMGFGAPNALGCASAFPWDCYMQAVPSGADAQHPTRIYGAGWNNGCAVKAELYGAERAARILNLSRSHHVRIECLEITDHAACVEFHSGGISCKRDTFPYGDWVPNGLYAADSSDMTLRNINIHGLANNGVLAGRLTDWTLEDVRIAGNGWAGWNGDISGGDSNSGTMIFRRVTIEWNGCGETFPGGQPTGCWGQSAGGYGDGLGTGETGGNWIFEDSKFLHNTSDGLDLLYHRGAGLITLERVRAEENAGNQIKTSGSAQILNSVIIGNCGYFSGRSFTYDVDDCRALGNAVSLRYDPGNAVTLSDSSIYSEGDCLLLATGNSCNGTESLVSRRNDFRRAPEFLNPDDRSCLFYSECGGLLLDDAGSTINDVDEGDYER